MAGKAQQPKRGKGRPPGTIRRKQVASFMRVSTGKKVSKAARAENLSISQWVERACVRELERSQDNGES